MVLATAFSRLIPWLLKLAIDSLDSHSDAEQVTRLVIAMVAAAAVGGVFLYLKRWLIRGAAREIEYDLRNDLYRHVQSLDMDFFGHKKTGDIMAHFTNDLSALRVVAGPGIMFATSTIIMLLMSIGAMIAINPFLTLVAFAPYPMISLATFFFARAMLARSRKVQDLFGEISSLVQEDLAGVRVIRAYRQEESRRGSFSELNLSYLEANMSVARLRGKFMAAVSAMAGSGLAIGLLVGGWQVIDGTLSLGSLVAFSAYLMELTWPVIAVGWIISMLQRGASAAQRLNEVLRVTPSITSGPENSRPAPAIRFEEVSFRHKGATRNALTDVSFQLLPGETLGIVGRTGSGKSTIFSLLQRFHDPTGGKILLGGLDIRDRDLDQLRRITGYAQQDALLFSRTIAQNIAYGKTSASKEEIEEIADRVSLRKEIEGFPSGFDALVGERGITLSGGQRQRVSLARALIKDPDLILLDSTLSSVDAKTERAILGQLRKYMADRTSIIASHRISAVQHADRILVLDQGRISEEGTHDALLKQVGLYSRIYEQQRLVAEIEGAK